MKSQRETDRGRTGQEPSDPVARVHLDTSRAEESVYIGRIQLLLAEKRTSLAALRTGIAIFTLPLSVTTVLITTSRYYNFMENLQFLIPLLAVCMILVATGTYLIVGSLIRFRHHGHQIGKIKAKDPKWQELID